MNKIDDIIVELFKETVINCNYDEAKGNKFANGLLDEKMSHIPKKVKEYVKNGGECNSLIISTYLIGLLNEKGITSYLVSTKDGFAVMYDNDGKFFIANPKRDVKYFTDRRVKKYSRDSYYPVGNKFHNSPAPAHDDSNYSLDDYSRKFGEIFVVGNMKKGSKETLRESIKTCSTRVVAPYDKATLDTMSLIDFNSVRGLANFLNKFLKLVRHEAYEKDGALYVYYLDYANGGEKVIAENSLKVELPKRYSNLSKLSISSEDYMGLTIECNVNRISEKEIEIKLKRFINKTDSVDLTFIVNDSKIRKIEMNCISDQFINEMKIEEDKTAGVEKTYMFFLHSENRRTRVVSYSKEKTNDSNYTIHGHVREGKSEFTIDAKKENGRFVGEGKVVENRDAITVGELACGKKENNYPITLDNEEEALADIKRLITHPRSMNTIAYLLGFTNYYFYRAKEDIIDLVLPNIELPDIRGEKAVLPEYESNAKFDEMYNKIICGKTNLRFPNSGIGTVDENEEVKIETAIKGAEDYLGEEGMKMIRDAINNAEKLTNDLVSNGETRSNAFIPYSARRDLVSYLKSYFEAVGSQYNIGNIKSYSDLERKPIVEGVFANLFENDYAKYMDDIAFYSQEFLDGNFDRTISEYIGNIRNIGIARDGYNEIGRNNESAYDRVSEKIDYARKYMFDPSSEVKLRNVLYDKELEKLSDEERAKMSEEDKMLYYYMVAFEQIAKITRFRVHQEEWETRPSIIDTSVFGCSDENLNTGADAYKLASHIRENLGLADTKTDYLPIRIKDSCPFEDKVRMVLWLYIKSGQKVFVSHRLPNGTEITINGEDIVELGKGINITPDDLVKYQNEKQQQEKEQDQQKKELDKD